MCIFSLGNSGILTFFFIGGIGILLWVKHIVTLVLFYWASQFKHTKTPKFFLPVKEFWSILQPSSLVRKRQFLNVFLIS